MYFLMDERCILICRFPWIYLRNDVTILFLKCQYLQYDRNNKACHHLKLQGNTLNMTFKSTRNTVTQISFMRQARSHFEDHSPRAHTGSQAAFVGLSWVNHLCSHPYLWPVQTGFKALCFCCHLRGSHLLGGAFPGEKTVNLQPLCEDKDEAPVVPPSRGRGRSELCHGDNLATASSSTSLIYFNVSSFFFFFWDGHVCSPGWPWA